MRASLGFRAGPLYVGTGNLLKTSRRRRRGPGLLDLFLVYPVIGMWLLLKYTFLLMYWWLPLYTWRGGSWVVRRIIAARAARRVEYSQVTPNVRPGRSGPQSASPEDSQPHAW